MVFKTGLPIFIRQFSGPFCLFAKREGRHSCAISDRETRTFSDHKLANLLFYSKNCIVSLVENPNKNYGTQESCTFREGLPDSTLLQRRARQSAQLLKNGHEEEEWTLLFLTRNSHFFFPFLLSFARNDALRKQESNTPKLLRYPPSTKS